VNWFEFYGKVRVVTSNISQKDFTGFYGFLLTFR